MVIGSTVIHWRTRASAARARAATARMRSRSVTMPTIRTKSSTTTTAPTFAAFIFSAASPIVSDGSTVRTSLTIRSATVSIPGLSQQSGEAPVLEDATAGLARRAVEDRVLLEIDLCERRAADVTRLGEPSVDAVGLLVGSAAFAQVEAACQFGVHRSGEALDLVVGQIGGERVRRELRRVEDLVRPGAADTGDQALIAEQCVQPPRLAAEDLAELRRVEAKRLRAEVAKLLLDLLRSQQPDPRPFLLRVLGQHELRAAGELERERGRLRPRLPGLERLQSPRRHQVHEQDERTVIGREEKPLPASLGAAQPPALELLQRR